MPRIVATGGALLVLWGVLEIGPKTAPYEAWPRGWILASVGLFAMVVGGPQAPASLAARARAGLATLIVAVLLFVLLFLRTHLRSGG